MGQVQFIICKIVFDGYSLHAPNSPDYAAKLAIRQLFLFNVYLPGAIKSLTLLKFYCVKYVLALFKHLAPSKYF